MKNGMFSGWKDVFAFTFIQNTKTKTFKTALIGISVLIFVIFFAINMITGYVKNNKKDSAYKNANRAENVCIINGIEIKDSLFENFKESDEYMENSEIIVYDDNTPDEIITEMEKNSKSAVVINVFKGTEDKKGHSQYMLDVYATKDLTEKNVIKITEKFSDYFDELKYNLTSLEPEDMKVILSDSNVYSMDIEDADESMGEMMAKIFVPMIFVLLIYMMILMYGQSISKSLIVEKNSKLMETLLTSLKPYAIVLGKILAMYVIAILQMVTWVIAGIAGFLISDRIAEGMFEKYDNPVIRIINLLKDGSSSAFSIESIVIGVAALLFGFLLYCVFAGLIASNITKAEELANGMSIYQMVVVIGFLAAYMLPLLQAKSPVVNAIRYIPVTSPFMLTSDVIMGNIGIGGAIVSMAIILISIIIMVIVTGKNYKKKVF